MRYKYIPYGVMLVAVTTLIWTVVGHKFVPAAMSANPAVQITSQHDGKSVRLVVGQELQVRLEAQPGTGYQWTMPQPLGFLNLERSDFEGGGLPGGMEVQVMRLRATGAGEGLLILHYMQPWAKQVPPTRVFTLSVMAVKR
jgi:predicted secreted protein